MSTRAQPRGDGHRLVPLLLWCCDFCDSSTTWFQLKFPWLWLFVCIRCFVLKGYFFFCGVFTFLTEPSPYACAAHCTAEDLWGITVMQNTAVTPQSTLTIVIYVFTERQIWAECSKMLFFFSIIYNSSNSHLGIFHLNQCRVLAAELSTKHKRWNAAVCFSPLMLLKQKELVVKEVQGESPQAEL